MTRKKVVSYIYNVNVHETLFENVITILPITYQNKTKMQGKYRSAWFVYKKCRLDQLYQAISV